MKHQKIYSILFISSLILFLISFLIQSPLMFTYSDYYGILLKMNWIYWLGFILLLVLISFQFSNFNFIDKRYVYLTLFLLIVYLIATPFLYETLPRFEDTWGHSFLAQEIFADKKVEHGISAYEQYPGSVLFYGSLFQLIPSYYVMKFLPPIFYIFGILIIYSLFKRILNEKTAFLIAILYMFFNWTVEDNHLSPQFLILNLYFLFIFIMVKLIDEKNNRKKYFLTLVFLGTIIVFSHPLTPIFLLFIMGSVFVLCKEYRRKMLPLIIILLIIFTTYEASRTTIFNSIIQYTKNFIEVLTHGLNLQTATQRFGTTFLSRQIFLDSRVGITLASMLLGSFGVIAMCRKKFKTEAKFFVGWAFALVPFLIFVGLTVKGEFYERFALISSLPLAVLAAYFFNEYKIKFGMILVFLLLLSPFYFIGKYGNEAFESISIEKLKANCFSYEFDSNCIENSKVVDSPLNYDIGNLGKSYFVVSREQIIYSSMLYGESVSDITDSINTIVKEYNLDRIYSTGTSSVYR